MRYVGIAGVYAYRYTFGALFPATCTDIYGRKFATTNYGMLYTAKGTAALLIPLTSVLTTATGSWHAAFYVAAVLNIVAALMAMFVLKPMRLRMLAQSELQTAAAVSQSAGHVRPRAT